MLSNEELQRRFAFHPANDTTGPLHGAVREHCLHLAMDLNDLFPNGGRELALAFTHLEEVMFWANAHVAREVSNEKR